MDREGMHAAALDLDVGQATDLQRIFSMLDGRRIVEKGFFRKAARGKVPVTVLLNGERLDPEEDMFRAVRDGDELVLLSPLSGG